jgi:hypothetical protein
MAFQEASWLLRLARRVAKLAVKFWRWMTGGNGEVSMTLTNRWLALADRLYDVNKRPRVTPPPVGRSIA